MAQPKWRAMLSWVRGSSQGQALKQIIDHTEETHHCCINRCHIRDRTWVPLDKDLTIQYYDRFCWHTPLMCLVKKFASSKSRMFHVILVCCSTLSYVVVHNTLTNSILNHKIKVTHKHHAGKSLKRIVLFQRKAKWQFWVATGVLRNTDHSFTKRPNSVRPIFIVPTSLLQCTLFSNLREICMVVGLYCGLYRLLFRLLSYHMS